MKSITLAAAVFSALTFTVSANDDKKDYLPFKAISPGKVTEQKQEGLKKAEQDALRRTFEEQQRLKENKELNVDPGQYLEGVVRNPNASFLGQDGNIYDAQGNFLGRPAGPAPATTQTIDRNNIFNDVKEKYKPQQKLTLAPGGNVMLPISAGLGNTIKTNFRSVAVKTSSSDAVIDIEEGYIVVTPRTRQPVDLKIYEEGVLDTMVNITLQPFDLPPAMIDVTIKMSRKLLGKVQNYRNQIAQAKKMKEEQAVHKDSRYSDEHVERLKEILTPVAKGLVPKGFTLKGVKEKDGIAVCNMSLPHAVGQQLVGARVIVDIVLVRNDWNDIYPLQEEACSGDGVMAVGIFDNATLQPGQETEIYIVRDKLYEAKKKQIRSRPRLNSSMFRKESH